MCYDYEKIRESLLVKISAGVQVPTVFGDLVLNRTACTLASAHDVVRVGGQELGLAWLLFRAQGTLISRDELVYFFYFEEEKDLPISNTIDVYLTRLRHKISELSREVEIACFRRVGVGLSLRLRAAA